MSIKILLTDDQSRVREAIRVLLENQLDCSMVKEVTSIWQLFDPVEYSWPDVLILDWKMPGPNVGVLIGKLHLLRPDLYIIVLDSNPQTKQPALESGADDFVSKNDPPERLLEAIRSSGHCGIKQYKMQGYSSNETLLNIRK